MHITYIIIVQYNNYFYMVHSTVQLLVPTWAQTHEQCPVLIF